MTVLKTCQKNDLNRADSGHVHDASYSLFLSIDSYDIIIY